MLIRRSLIASLLLTAAAAAQTPTPATPATPAPMPDPLMSPDLQRTTTSPPRLSSLVQQSTWQGPVIAAARAQYKQMPDGCAAASFKPTGELTIYAPVQFDGNGTLQAGIWSERVAVTGCATPKLLNILTVLQPGSAPGRIPTMPGDTHADPATQKTALQYAQAVAIRASPPNCRAQVFIDTKFDGFTGLPDQTARGERAWREEWSLFACGSVYSIQLMFKPNAQGMQLTASNPVKRS